MSNDNENDNRTDSGLYLPNRKAAENITSAMKDQAFLDEQEMEQADKGMSTYWVALLWIAAASSWGFGFLAVFTNDPTKDLRAAFWAWLAGMIVLLLLDGSRYYWSLAKIAKGKTPAQRWIAFGMEILNFGGSFVASFLTLPYLLVWIGIPFVNNADLMESMKIIIQWSFGLNLAAGFVFALLSPHAQKLATLSKLDSDMEQKVLNKLSRHSQESMARMDKMLGKYEDEIQEKLARKQLGYALSRLDHGEIQALPDHYTVPQGQNGSSRESAFLYVNGQNGHK